MSICDPSTTDAASQRPTTVSKWTVQVFVNKDVHTQHEDPETSKRSTETIVVRTLAAKPNTETQTPKKTLH